VCYSVVDRNSSVNELSEHNAQIYWCTRDARQIFVRSSTLADNWVMSQSSHSFVVISEDQPAYEDLFQEPLMCAYAHQHPDWHSFVVISEDRLAYEDLFQESLKCTFAHHHPDWHSFVVIDKSRCASRLAGGSRGGMRHHSYNRGASLVVYATWWHCSRQWRAHRPAQADWSRGRTGLGVAGAVQIVPAPARLAFGRLSAIIETPRLTG
jgi:hypothetical protein